MKLRGTYRSRLHPNRVVRRRWRCWINSDSLKSHLLRLDFLALFFLINLSVVTGLPYSQFVYVMPQHISAQVDSITKFIITSLHSITDSFPGLLGLEYINLISSQTKSLTIEENLHDFHASDKLWLANLQVKFVME